MSKDQFSKGSQLKILYFFLCIHTCCTSENPFTIQNLVSHIKKSKKGGLKFKSGIIFFCIGRQVELVSLRHKLDGLTFWIQYGIKQQSSKVLFINTDKEQGLEISKGYVTLTFVIIAHFIHFNKKCS